MLCSCLYFAIFFADKMLCSCLYFNRNNINLIGKQKDLARRSYVLVTRGDQLPQIGLISSPVKLK